MKNIVLLLLLCVGVASCTSKSTIYRAPDESQVETRKNLTLPPDYELRPPREAKK